MSRMKRSEKVKKKACKLIEEGEKVSTARISQELGMHPSDVHRCLNYLERNKEVKTERKNVFGTEHRMVSVYR